MNIDLINVPIFYGADKKGVDLGSKKLKEKNIIETLSKHNHDINDLGNIYVEQVSNEQKYEFHNKMKYLKPIIDVNTKLAEQVYNSLTANHFPFILGGDHSIGLGSISGASKYYDDIAVIWIDAHGDINTDETSPTGNIHGMPLAAAMGKGYKDLTNLYYNGIKVKPENVILLGARDLDEGEKELIKKYQLTIYSTEDIKKIGIEEIMNLVNYKLQKNKIKNVHLSFDIDCIDPIYAPGTGTSVQYGLNISQVKYILKHLIETKLIKSMDFVEFNPLLDYDNKTLDLCIDLLDWIFKYL